MPIRYLSGLSVDSTVLVVDAANDRVGIGTASPAYKLDVDSGSGQIAARFYNSSNVSTLVYIGDTGNSDFSDLILQSNSGTGEIFKNGTAYSGYGGTLSLNIYNSNGAIAFHPNGIANAMFINTSGNVGIGTTSPSDTLDLYQAANTTAIRLTSAGVGSKIYRLTSQLIGVSNAGFGIQNATDGRYELAIDGSGNVGIGTTSPGGQLSIFDTNNSRAYQMSFGYETTETFRLGNNNATGKFTFTQLNNSNGFRFTSVAPNSTGIIFDINTSQFAVNGDTGNVGVGTTNPDAIFHVAKSTSGGVGGQIVIDNPASSALGNTAELSFLTDVGASGSGTRNAKILAVNVNAGNGAAELQFHTWNGAAELKRLNIASNGVITMGAYGSGNVTGTPTYNLAVDASGNIIETAGGVVDGSGTANYVSKWSDANTLTDSVIYDDGTNVGIGTASPTQKLEVDGVIESPYLEFKPVVFYDFNSDTTGDWSKGNSTLSVPNDSVTRYTSTGADSNISKAFNFDGGQNQIIRIRYKVVTGPSGGGEIFYANSQHGYDASYFKSFTLVSDGAWHTLVLDMSSLNAGGTDWIDYNVTLIRFDLTNVSGVAIDIDWISIGGNGYGTQYFENDVAFMNGNVGIGTTAPAQKLHVDGAIRLTSNPSVTGDGSSAQFWNEAGVGPTIAGANFQVRTNGNTTALHINSSQNVGIGTTNPGAKLDVYRGLQTDTITRANAAAYIWGADVGLAIGQYSSGPYGTWLQSLKYDNNNSFPLSLNPSGGNVGIGTTEPDAIFHVAKAVSSGVGGQIVIDNPSSSAVGNTAELSFLTDAGASGAGTRNAKILAVNTNAGNGAAELQFHTWNGAAELKRMNIAYNGVITFGAYGSGNVTGTPTYNLGVDASGNVIELPGGVVDGSGTANYVTKWSDANTLTDSVIYDNGTNVGIGTLPNQGVRLQVAGSVDVWSSLNTLLRLSHDGTRGIIESYTGGGFSPTAINPSGGNVLIGTTTDSGYKLAVNGSITSANYSYLSTYGYGATQLRTYEISTGTSVSDNQIFNLYLGRFGNGYHRITLWGTGYGTDSGNYFDITRTWNGTPFIITNGGLILGGAQYTIHWAAVSSGAYDLFIKYYAGMPTGYSNQINYAIQSNTGYQYVQFDYPGGVTVPTLDGSNLVASRMTIQYTSGNVGIGTTAPATKLDITGTLGFTVGAASAIIRRTTVNGSNGIVIQGNANDTVSDTNPGASIFVGGGALTDTYEGNIVFTAYGEIVDANRNQIKFFNRSGVNTVAERMRINHLGNVGIGTTSPSARLDVVGSIVSTGPNFLNQSNLYNSPTPGLTGYGNVAMDDSVSYYDTGKNVSTGTRGLVWTGKHYILTDYVALKARFYDNNFTAIPNPYGAEISLPNDGNTDSAHGAAWDGRYLYCVQYNGSGAKIVAYNLDNGTATATIVFTQAMQNTASTYDIEYAEGHLYTCTGGAVSKYKVEGKTITHVFTSANILSSLAAQAITYDGSYLWFTQNGANAYKVSLDCVLVATITTGLPANNVAWAWNGQNVAAVNYTTGDVYIINTAETRFDTEEFLVMGGLVGIGTTSPSRILTVSAPSGDTLLRANAVTGSYVGLELTENNSTTSGQYWQINKVPTSHRLQFWNGSERLTVLSGGNVGIGTTGPSNKLHIRQTGIVDNTATTLLLLDGQFQDGSIEEADMVSIGFRVENSTGGSQTSQAISFAYNNILSLMKDGGNVGIGTTAPTAKLTIGVNTSVQSTNGIALGVGETSLEFVHSTFQNGFGSKLYSVDSGSGVTSLRIATRPDSTSWSDAITIIAGTTNNGNVGIGTTSPGQKLQIDSPLRTEFYGTDNASPADAMNIVGTGASRALGTGSALLFSVPANTDGTNMWAQARILGTGDNATNGNAEGAMFLQTRALYNPGVGGSWNWRTNMVLRASGNVGIGTTAPSARLTVKSLSSGALGINILGRDGDSYGLLTFKDSGDTSTFAEVGGNTSTGFLVNNYVNTYTAFSTNSVERMRITAGGNVLIGTTTDGGYKLRVNGEILADDDIRILNTYALVLNGTDNNWRIGRNTITDTGWLTSNTMQMVVFGGSTGQGFQVVNSNGTALFEIDGVAGASRFTNALGVGVNPSGTAGRIDASNDIVAFQTSDRRLKENITPIANALDKVKSLTGVEFDWKEETKHVHGYEGHDTGIIAQEVQAVMPTAVRTNDSGYLSVRYEKLIGLLVEANKELAARVEELEAKLK